MEPVSRHQCLIYEGAPSRQLPALAVLIRQKLDEGYRCLYLNSPAMISGMRSTLAALGVSIVSEIKIGRIVLSSESTLSPDGNFDVDLMIEKLEYAVDRALDDGYKGLWASGDMTWEFGDKKNLGKLLEYEWRLEEIIRNRHELCGICQYHRDTLPAQVMRQGLLSHQTICISETISRINPHFAQSRFLAEEASKNLELDGVISRFCRSGNT
jgi:hypothetical protein